jgi:flagellar export protein FliJ
MGFRFPLATVLRYRESLEKREEVALQKVQLEILQVRLQMQQLDKEIAGAQQSREAKLRETISAFQLQAMLDEVNTAVEQKRQLQEELEKLEQLRKERMKAYQAAHRSRQMLSDIRGRQQDAYELDAARRQQKVLDDLFATRRRRS